MRVVMLSKALVVGAYQRKLEELACLPGVDLTLIVPASWHDRRGETRLERAFTRGYRVLVAPLAFNGQYHLHWYPTLGRMLRGLRPEILHVDEEPYNLATWQALRLGRSVGARGLVLYLAEPAAALPAAFQLLRARQLSAGVSRHCRKPGGFAGAACQGLRRACFGGAPVRRGPGDLPAGAESEQPTGGRSELVIGYSGALIPEKGVALLLQACARPTLRRLDAGNTRRRRASGRIWRRWPAELGIAGRVRFWGRVPSTEAPEYYRRFDLLVLPSHHPPELDGAVWPGPCRSHGQRCAGDWFGQWGDPPGHWRRGPGFSRG